MKSEPLPLISCLCVSSDRPHFLRKTIDYFQKQTYPHKELIIVSRRLRTEYKQIVESANSPDVKYFFLEDDRKLTLGELRNHSIEMSAGEYFCIWDDDDWSHRSRLEHQLQAAVSNIHLCFPWRHTWDEKHFDHLFGRQAHRLSPRLSQLVEDVLNNRYSYQRSSDLLRSPDVMKEFDYFPSEYLREALASAIKGRLPV